jgi:hypothetical protein
LRPTHDLPVPLVPLTDDERQHVREHLDLLLGRLADFTRFVSIHENPTEPEYRHEKAWTATYIGLLMQLVRCMASAIGVELKKAENEARQFIKDQQREERQPYIEVGYMSRTDDDQGLCVWRSNLSSETAVKELETLRARLREARVR